MGRIGRVVGTGIIALTAVVALGSPASAACVRAWSTEELRAAADHLFAWTMQERSAHGLEPLAVQVEIAQVGDEHAVRMADAGEIFHNDAYLRMHARFGATSLGENVGRGCSAEDIHVALMDSPSHRENILKPTFTHLGIGVTAGDGWLYIVQGFATIDSPAQDQAPATETSMPDPQGSVPSPEPATPERDDQLVRVEIPSFEHAEAPASVSRSPAAERATTANDDVAEATKTGTAIGLPLALLASIGFAFAPRRDSRT